MSAIIINNGLSENFTLVNMKTNETWSIKTGSAIYEVNDTSSLGIYDSAKENLCATISKLKNVCSDQCSTCPNNISLINISGMPAINIS